MSEEPKRGTKPTGPIANAKIVPGLEKPPTPTAEVSGHRQDITYYTCWKDGTVNWVRSEDHFYCWKCHAFNLCQPLL